MNLPTFTRATRASMHLNLAKSLGVAPDDIASPEAAFIEAVCWSESAGTTLLLAECVEDLIDRHISADGLDVIIDPSGLRSLYDQHTVSTALKLAGCYESPRSGQTVWSTCRTPQNTLPRVVISGDVLNEWTKL